MELIPKFFMTATTTPAVGVATEFAPNRRPGTVDRAGRRERTAEMTVPAPLRVSMPLAFRFRFGNRQEGPHVAKSLDSFNCRRTLTVGGAEYVYYSLVEAEKNGLTGHRPAALSR